MTLIKRTTRPLRASRFEDFFGRDADLFNQMGRMFQEWDANSAEADFTPALNIREEEDSYEVEAEIPGVSRDNIDIEIHQNRLILKGEKRSVDEEKKEHYHRVERSHGTFFRTMTLPENIDQDKVSARLDHGVLHISIGKAQTQKSRKVDIL